MPKAPKAPNHIPVNLRAIVGKMTGGPNLQMRKKGLAMTTKAMKKNLDEYTALSRQIAELEARKQAVANRIKAGMDGAEEMKCGGYIARNRTVTSARFDAKAFRAAYECLYNEFCRPQTVQRFTIVAA